MTHIKDIAEREKIIKSKLISSLTKKITVEDLKSMEQVELLIKFFRTELPLIWYKELYSNIISY